MIPISRITFTPARGVDRISGIIGWIRFLIGNAVVVDGVTLRRTAAGRLVFTWPRRKAGFPVVRPWDDDARRAIEEQLREAVLAQLEAGA